MTMNVSNYFFQKFTLVLLDIYAKNYFVSFIKRKMQFSRQFFDHHLTSDLYDVRTYNFADDQDYQHTRIWEILKARYHMTFKNMTVRILMTTTVLWGFLNC